MAFLMNYDLNPTILGVNSFGRQPANYNGNTIAIYNTQLAATTNKQLTVPSSIGAGRLANNVPEVLVILSYASGATVFVAVTTPTNGVTTAAPDTSGSFVANPAIINPTALIVHGGDILNIYPAAQAFVSVEFYSVT